MSGEDTSEDLSIKNNFLTVLHTLKFSNESESVNEACHVERRCLAARYMAAKRFNDEDTANFLLKKGLENYQRLMDDTAGTNNHLSHVETLLGKKVVDNADWRSGFKDIKAALQFVKPLSCRNDNLKICLKKEFDDRHIRDIVEAWKREDSSSRPRKISVKHPSSSNHETIKGNLDSLLVSKQPSLSNYCVKMTKQQERSTKNDVEYQKLISMLPKEFDNREPISDTRCPGRSQLSSHHSESSSIIHNKGNSKLFSRDSDTARSFEKDENRSQHHEISHYFKRTLTNQSHSEAVNETRNQKPNLETFRTATEEFRVQQQSKNQQLPQKRSTGTLLGGKRTVNRPFICPLKRSDNDEENTSIEEGNSEDSRLKNIDAKMVELIKSEIMDSGAPVSWDDIAGLEFAKNTIKEIVVLPLLRPDIFTGLRRPPKGILLFGPPGTGKTLIGKCIASQSKSTFFSISASSLASKWIGEGEKLVRALFAVARVYQPAVVFIDEIDSLLSKRSDNEHDSTRKVKTEFLVQLDGAATAEDDRILIVGATNRPHELDEAARRRLVKRLYVPLPEIDARKQIITNLLRSERHNVSSDQVDHIAELTDGYSGADMTNLCKEASMGPIRSIPLNEFENINQGDVREVTVDDFLQALSFVRASVSKADLSVYVEWDSTYGTGTAQRYNS